MKLLVSACLLGEAVRYDGTSKEMLKIQELAQKHELFPFCPELSAGLPVPRSACEIKGTALGILTRGAGGVFAKEGTDFSQAFRKGAQNALALCQAHEIQVAILKERSPSCGVHWVYDGSHAGKIIPGEGVTAAFLRCNGIEVLTENNFGEALT